MALAAAADKGLLLIMLCQGALEAIDESLAAIDAKDYEGKNRLLVRAQDIVLQLSDALDEGVGGEMAVNLRRLYQYIYSELVRGNTRLDKEAILRGRRVMADLTQTWQRVVLGDDSSRFNVGQ